MGFVTSALLLFCFTFRVSLGSEPGLAFPDGVAALVADMRDRLASASAEHGDDTEAVAKLKQEGIVQLPKILPMTSFRIV